MVNTPRGNGNKIVTSVTIDPELFLRARADRLNISQIVEDGLRTYYKNREYPDKYNLMEKGVFGNHLILFHGRYLTIDDHISFILTKEKETVTELVPAFIKALKENNIKNAERIKELFAEKGIDVVI